jgi:hypothetical protein
MTYVIGAANTLVAIWVMLTVAANSNMFFVSRFGAPNEFQYALAMNMASGIFNTSVSKELVRTGVWLGLALLIFKLGAEFGGIALVVCGVVQLAVVLVVKYMTYRQARMLEEQYGK